MIASIHNARIKHLRQLLTQSKQRKIHQAFVIEGVHLLQMALQNHYSIQQVFLPQSQIHDAELSGCLKQLASECIEIVEDSIISKMTDLTHGVSVMAQIQMPPLPDLPHQQDCVVLETIQDPGNLGTILRTAAATGIRHIVLNNCCADVFSPKVLRAGMGAHFLLHIYQNIDLVDFLQNFSGCLNVTTLHHASMNSLYHLDLTQTNAWVFGNEGAGVSPSILKLIDYGVHIPMMGKTESLNVAMAATVCLFEQQRQRIFQAGQIKVSSATL